MSDEYYQPLTPEFRSKVNSTINQNLAELNSCNNTVYVSAYKTAYGALRNIINALPDGYPIPMKRNGE